MAWNWLFLEKLEIKSSGLVRFPPPGGEGRGFADYLASKPLPAASHPIAPLLGGN